MKIQIHMTPRQQFGCMYINGCYTPPTLIEKIKFFFEFKKKDYLEFQRIKSELYAQKEKLEWEPPKNSKLWRKRKVITIY